MDNSTSTSTSGKSILLRFLIQIHFDDYRIDHYYKTVILQSTIYTVIALTKKSIATA